MKKSYEYCRAFLLCAEKTYTQLCICVRKKENHMQAGKHGKNYNCTSLNLRECRHLFMSSDRIFRCTCSLSDFKMANFSVRHKSHTLLPHLQGCEQNRTEQKCNIFQQNYVIHNIYQGCQTTSTNANHGWTRRHKRQKVQICKSQAKEKC